MRTIALSAATAAGAAVFAVSPAMATVALCPSIDARCSYLEVVGGTVVAVSDQYGPNGLAQKESEGLTSLGLSWTSGDLAHVSTDYNNDGKDFLDILNVSALYGDIYVGFHVGNASPWGNATYFFHIVADEGGVTSIVPNTELDADGIHKGLSNGKLYAATLTPPTDPVPEPATWAMMLLGFGLVGMGARRRARRAVTA